MPSPELIWFDLDLLELLRDRKWEDAASLLRNLAAKGGRVSLHPHIVSELAHRLTESGRKKSRGRQCDPMVENIVLGEVIERELQGTSPLEVFLDVVVHDRPHSPNPVPQGERGSRLNEISHGLGISQSKAEKARAASNCFLKVANQFDPLEDPPTS
jgi:hypothetical protein